MDLRKLRRDQVEAVVVESQSSCPLRRFSAARPVVGRMGSIGRVARIRRAQFRRVLAAEPDIGEIIMRAFVLRRVGMMDHEQAASR